jgi:hypothetical protein
MYILILVVIFPGPPPVRTKIVSKTLKDSMNLKNPEEIIDGKTKGKIT